NSGYHHHQGVYHWSADHASHHHRIGAVFLESSSGIHAPCGWRGGHSGSHLRGSGGRRKIPLPAAFALRRAQDMELVEKNLPPSVRTLALQSGAQTLPDAAKKMLGEVPELHIRKLAETADLK